MGAQSFYKQLHNLAIVIVVVDGCRRQRRVVFVVVLKQTFNYCRQLNSCSRRQKVLSDKLAQSNNASKAIPETEFTVRDGAILTSAL